MKCDDLIRLIESCQKGGVSRIKLKEIELSFYDNPPAQWKAWQTEPIKAIGQPIEEPKVTEHRLSPPGMPSLEDLEELNLTAPDEYHELLEKGLIVDG